jgi:glycine cleavage system transcriptional repressor
VNELAVTAIGANRPGIVAAVTHVLHERGGNLEDSAMTILGGHFAVQLLVATEDAPDALQAALQDATAELGLTITVTRAAGRGRGPAATHLLSVYGADKPGIVATVTAALAATGANVTDLETQVIGSGAEAVYAMVIELVVPDGVEVEPALTTACEELGVDHTLRTISTETY